MIFEHADGATMCKSVDILPKLVEPLGVVATTGGGWEDSAHGSAACQGGRTTCPVQSARRQNLVLAEDWPGAAERCKSDCRMKWSTSSFLISNTSSFVKCVRVLECPPDTSSSWGVSFQAKMSVAVFATNMRQIDSQVTGKKTVCL